MAVRGERTSLSDYGLILGGVFLSADIFGLDLMLPPGVEVLYSVVVLLGLMWPGKGYIVAAALGVTVLTVIGSAQSPAAADIWEALFSRSLSVLVIWMTAFLCLARKSSASQRQELMDRLDWVSLLQSRASQRPRDKETLDNILQSLLHLTASEYGVVGEVLTNSKGNPYLKSLSRATSNAAWENLTRAAAAESAASGAELYSLDTLFGTVIATGKPLITNNPSPEPGNFLHPRLTSFMGLPFYQEGKILGVLGLANRPGGYDDELAESLQPLLTTLAGLVSLSRADRHLEETRETLRQREEDLKDAEHARERIEESLKEKEDRLDKADQDRDRTEKTLVEGMERLQEMVLERERLQEALRERDDRILHIDRERERVESELLENENRFHRLQRERKNLEEDRQEEEDRLRRLQRERDSLQDELREKEDRLRRADRERERLEDAARESASRPEKRDREKLEEMLREIDERLRSRENERRETDKLLEERDRDIHLLQEELEKTKRELQEPFSRLEQVEDELEGNRKSLREKEDLLRGADRERGQIEEALRESDERRSEADRGRLRMVSELKELQAKNEAILNAAEEGIFGLNLKGDITFINRAGARLMGYEPQELIGKHHFDVFRHSRQDGTPYSREDCPIQKMLKSGKRVHLVDEVFWNKDGSCLYLDCTGSPVSEDESLVGAIVSLTDTTQLKRLADELDHADEETEREVESRTRELEEKNERLQQEIVELKKKKDRLRNRTDELARSNADYSHFALFASHDLQDPLRKIIAFASQLKKESLGSLNEKAKDYLARMERTALRMRQFIDDLLDYSKASTQPRALRPVKLGKVMNVVLSLLDERIAKTKARIEVGDLPVIEGDEFQMQQLLQNLVGNALKFHKEGVPPLISIQSRPCGDGFHEITVTDNGIGFDESFLQRIFQPFDRLHGRSQYEGSGIGLAICQEVVNRHGGEITARSSKGQGSTFIVRLPARQAKVKKILPGINEPERF